MNKKTNRIKIVGINSLGYGSPAVIMNNILYTAKAKLGAEVYSFYGAWGKKNNQSMCHCFGYKIESVIAKGLSMLTGYQHIWCVVSTKQLLKQLDIIKPDIIHLHNLHLWNINVPMLFNYIKQNNIKVVWTLHDCWSFTGQCPYFSEINCDKWKNQCGECPQLKRYPATYIDHTKQMFELKKDWFLGVDNLTIVSPSQWLKGLVSESFLKGYPAICINNGIDMNVFQPLKSNIRYKYKLNSKHIILGVSLEWGYRKGLDVFLKLSEILNDNFKIVLVGIDKDLEKNIPSSIVCIERTQNQHELAEIYSAADVFINPTREDNFPTVNIEALACGTPVITSSSGGSSEMIDETCGFSVNVSDIPGIVRCIENIVYKEAIDRKKCREHAMLYNANTKFEEYIELYKKIISL